MPDIGGHAKEWGTRNLLGFHVYIKGTHALGKGTIFHNPNSSTNPKHDYLLSRRRIIGGNNPSVSLTVSVFS